MSAKARNGVIKRGATWSFYIELPADPVTKKRRKKWISGFRTRKEAEQARDDARSKLTQGVFIEPTKQTTEAYLQDWLTAITSTVRPSTLHSYRRNLELHVIPHIGRLRLGQVDAVVLNGLYADLLASGRADRPGGLSPRSVRYVHTILHRAFKDAVRWRRLIVNPVDAADPPRAAAHARAEMRTWSADTLGAFLRHSQETKDRYFAAWYVLATTGVRRGEVLGLRWADLDLDAATASIVQTVIVVKHDVRFGSPKTAKGRRSVALDPGTVAVLREHRRHQLEERLLMGAGWQDHDLLFTKVDGTPIHPERFSREFDRRNERWSLPRIRLHDLRHTWATLALQAGIHPKIVSERLGHANITITLDTYSHVTPTMQAEAAATVAGLFTVAVANG
jgi:integrase